MKKILLYSLSAILLGSCAKELQVENPNLPTLEQLNTEKNLVGLASGGVYLTGFNGPGGNSLGWLGDSYFSLCLGYHSLLGDEVGAEAANQLINQVSLPDKVTYDDGTSTINSAPSKDVFRINNSINKPGANAFFYEWSAMYAMNNACNRILTRIDSAKYTNDPVEVKKTLKAWAYFWKGFAYAKIGSLYYAGLINDNPINTLLDPKSSTYVNSQAIITESNKNFNAAKAILAGMTGSDSYDATVLGLIPSFCQVGHGGLLSPAEWVRNINTMLARNILVNKSVNGIGGLPQMTVADWTAVLNLTNNGISSSDLVFTGRTATANGFFSAASGSVQAMTAINSAGSGLKTFRVSERLYQDFKPTDARRTNNFVNKIYRNQVGGFIFSTRYALKNRGSIANNDVGAQEIYIAGSFEENELMKAEATMYLGSFSPASITAGLAMIDNVRNAQGANLGVTTAATAAAAKEELRKERRVALAFRGLAFYDARRWGVIYDVANGGGRSGAVVYTSASVLNINAKINYNFLDYWDVPDDEIKLNPPAAGSAPVKNPM
jgi:starch-binding outer membrane protein, SusD/RagB family